MKDEKMPCLMTDDSATDRDGHAETMMDYVISWTLRCAAMNKSFGKPILAKSCKRILCNLIGFANNKNIDVVSVKTWKQESRIDLWVEAEILCDGVAESHALLIENKYYSRLHDAKDIDGIRRNQLLVYRKKFDEYYDESVKEYKRHYILITCIERTDEKFEQYLVAEDYGFKIFDFYEVRGDDDTETESDIYNEFWLRW